ncbi:hypothetical protein [Dietzia sp. DQ12-76]|uniref:hypothetical protein n=1 Tax=Dietzia sp. DQ12-76 TaxID=1630639 RepID=UPI0015F93C5F|nr:hypothetical protein [Dietzia sp. DQ12-76]MBB1023077.1 hypothetical protein [Dietzia sp. DQ12-76]
MTINNEASRPWLRRLGRPTALVMFAVVALLALGATVSIVDMVGSPPPPAELQYGPFSNIDLDPSTVTSSRGRDSIASIYGL